MPGITNGPVKHNSMSLFSPFFSFYDKDKDQDSYSFSTSKKRYTLHIAQPVVGLPNRVTFSTENCGTIIPFKSLFQHRHLKLPGGLLYIFWVRGRVIGKGIDFHDFGIRNGIDFHDFGIRNGIDFRNFRNWYRVGYAFSENWYKIRYIF